MRDGVSLVPLLAGGGQEGGARAGTENLPGVAAMAAVLRCLDQGDASFQDAETLAAYRDRLVASLKTAFPLIVFNTPFEQAVPTTINFSVKGFASKEILDLFDAAGIRVSSGSACGSALVASYVLQAMGLPKWRSEGAVRVSFGPVTREDEIVAACHRIEQAGEALCESCLPVASRLGAASGLPIDGLIQLKNGSLCSWALVDAESKACIVIDPCEALADRIESLIRCQQSRVLAVLDTHQHLDHDSCRTRLLKILGDHPVPTSHSTDVLGWPVASDGVAILDDDSKAEYLRWSSREVIVRTRLPGHTTDGQAFLVGALDRDGRLRRADVRFAFTGDTLLLGGLGRTDLDNSSVDDLYRSLQRLPRVVSGKTVICPTHDYTNGFATTIDAERRGNDFLRRVWDPIAPLSLEQFRQTKANIDAEITQDADREWTCGLIQPYLDHEAALVIRARTRSNSLRVIRTR